MRKRKQNQDLFPHPWGGWREEGTIPIEGSAAYWKSNNFSGYDLVSNGKVVAYVKRVTYEVREGWRRGFVQEKDEVDHYVALIEIDKMVDLGKCKTSRDARQRILDHLTENQHGWDQDESVPF